MNDTSLTTTEQQQLDNARGFLALAEQQAMQSGQCPSAHTLKQVQAARQAIARLEPREEGKSNK